MQEWGSSGNIAPHHEHGFQSKKDFVHLLNVQWCFACTCTNGIWDTLIKGLIMGLQWRPITCLVIQVDGLNRWWAQVHLLRGGNVGEGRVSYDVSTVDPAAAGVECTTVRHFVAQVRERVELKQTVVSCGVEWRGLIEDVCQRGQPKGRPNPYTKDNFEELPWVGFEHMSLCSLYFQYVTALSGTAHSNVILCTNTRSKYWTARARLPTMQ